MKKHECGFFLVVLQRSHRKRIVVMKDTGQNKQFFFRHAAGTRQARDWHGTNFCDLDSNLFFHIFDFSLFLQLADNNIHVTTAPYIPHGNQHKLLLLTLF